MNRFDTTGITDPSKQLPLLGPSVAFMQDANKDMFNAFALSLIGDLYNGSDPYSIIGCTFTLSGQYFTGYIYWNQEVFKFRGQNRSAFINNGVFVISDAATGPMDPYYYTDGSVANVHRTRELLLVDQANGTGAFNLSLLKYVQNGATTAWTAVTFTTNFSSATVNSVLRTVKYRIDKTGQWIEFQGVITSNGSNAANEVMFTLPSGFRPPIINSISVNPATSTYLSIATTGDTYINISNVIIVYLDGLKIPKV